MRRSIRSLGIVAFVIACVLTLGWSSPLATLVQLLGTTALIMGGTEHPLVNPLDRLPDFDGQSTYGFAETGLAGADGQPAGYVSDALTKYIDGAGPVAETYDVKAVWTPEEFWPVLGSQTFDASVRTGVSNLDLCVRGDACVAHVYPTGQGGSTDIYSVFAYSQSARIASLEKASLIDEYNAADPDTIHHVTFVMIGNPNRPNGGVLQRFKGLHIPILDVTFDGASPTNSPVVGGDYLYPTADIARQFDGWDDFPLYPLNLLADLNAVAGIAFLHSDYFFGNTTNPVAGQPYLYQGQVGDTNYYMLATKRLPILLPLAAIGVPDPILAALDAPLRVMVEWGYNRDISPGVPTPAQLFRPATPIADTVHLAVATLTGLDDAVSEAVGDPAARPLHTKPVESTFGVGGTVLPTATDPVAPPSPPVQLVALGAPSASDIETKTAGAGAPPRLGDEPKTAGAGSEPATPSGSTEANAGDNTPKSAKRAKTGLHRATRHKATRTASPSAAGPDTVAPKNTASRHRMKHPRESKNVGGHRDSRD